MALFPPCRLPRGGEFDPIVKGVGNLSHSFDFMLHVSLLWISKGLHTLFAVFEGSYLFIFTFFLGVVF